MCYAGGGHAFARDAVIQQRGRAGGWVGCVLLLVFGTALASVARAEQGCRQWLSMATAGEHALDFDLPAAPLSDTLNQIARRSARIISVVPTLLKGRSANPVHGRYTPEQAACVALAGNPLELVVTGSGSLSIQPSSHGIQQDDSAAPSAASLPPLLVREDGMAVVTAADDYLASQAQTGLKMAATLAQTPQAAEVLLRQQLDDQGGTTLQDALRYSPGVIGTRGVNFTDDSFNMRGFAAGLATSANTPVFRDGLRQAPTMYASIAEPYGVERIEILRGPSAVLYGQGTPGGTINLISKRPPSGELREVGVQFGSDSHRQATLDIGGAADTTGEWRYRVTALVRDAGSEVDFIDNDRRYLAPAITWRPSARTSLELQAMYQSSRTRYNWGLPVSGSLLRNPNGSLPRSLYTGEPGFDRFDTDAWSAGWILEHQLDDHWQFHQGARYQYSTLHWNSAYGIGLESNQRLLDRFAFVRNDQNAVLMLDNRLQGKWHDSVLEHDFSVGLDMSRMTWLRRESRGTIGALDLFAPQYGNTQASNIVPVRTLDSTSTDAGLYLQDRVRTGAWTLLGGLRHDWIRAHLENLLNGQQLRSSDNALTTRLGLLYALAEGWSPYVNAATTFEPEYLPVDFNGNSFAPTTAQQFEAGLKYESSDHKTIGTLAAFQIIRRNELTADPVHLGYSIQTGQTRSRGVEVEFKSQFDRQWQLLLSYTYMNAVITRSNNGDQGQSPAGVPRHVAAAWAVYRFSDRLAGWRAGAGLREIMGTAGYVLGTTPTPPRLPDYTVVDTMLSYDSGPWRVTLNINNLFDTSYIQSCYYAATGCYYGPGRTFQAGITRRW